MVIGVHSVGYALPVQQSRCRGRMSCHAGPAYEILVSDPLMGRPLFEAAAASFAPRSPLKVNTGNGTRGPLLLIADGNDHAVPAAITRSTRRLYSRSPAVTDYKEFPDRGHSLVIDGGWHQVADTALTWLQQHAL